MNPGRAIVLGLLLAWGARAEPIIFFDATRILPADLKEEGRRRQYWDELHLITALQGLVNRDQPRLFVRYLKESDDFWWHEMRQPGSWLAGRDVVEVNSLDGLLARFAGYYRGAVAWDEHTPATSDLASTVAGCDNLLPLRIDSAPGSLYQRLTASAPALQIKVRLAFGAKSDAYRWLIDNYVRTGKANPACMGYYLDAFWLQSWQATAPQNSGLCDQDYIIAHRGIVFDLDPWNDEAPIDAPGEPAGADASTLQDLLRAACDRMRGGEIIQVAGFVPWAYKYTASHNAHWAAGGHHKGVPTEWRYAEILSCFNACMDADALSLNAFPNASFYQHYPLAAHYPQNPKPTAQTLAARGLIDSQGRVAPKIYVAFYVGDYDSSAWLYQKLHAMWRDRSRGAVPLSWAFDPNLCERFPFGMAWARARRTANDWFVAGDSGAGYLNPGYLTPPRPYSGLPSGLPEWEKRCAHFYQQWDLSLTGFIINGFARGASPDVFAAYGTFSPDGIITQGGRREVQNGVPRLAMAADIGDPNPAAAAQKILALAPGSGPVFLPCRTVLKSPNWHAQVARELLRLRGRDVQVVDLYTLLALVRAAQVR